jgi:hypothetical protein
MKIRSVGKIRSGKKGLVRQEKKSILNELVTPKKEYSFFWLQDGKLKNSGGSTAEEALDEFRARKVEPITTYPISSVEMNMFRTHILEAIDIVKPKDAKALIKKADECERLTPYTNWSGD